MKKIILSIALIGSLIGGYGYYHYGYQASDHDHIHSYDNAHDREFFKRLFNDHFYLLTANPDTSIDFILDEKAPNPYEPRYFGKLEIKILREQASQVGFVCYYMLSQYVGRILFLCIDKSMQGKRYGEKLVKHAVQDLKNRGAQLIRVWCRVDNPNGRKFYERLGFINSGIEGMIDYRLKI